MQLYYRVVEGGERLEALQSLIREPQSQKTIRLWTAPLAFTIHN